VLIRPADANETAQAWKFAINHRHGPTAFALTRQSVPTIDRSRYQGAEGLQKGAYVLADLGQAEPELILMASGSEVDLIIKAGEKLAAEGISLRLVSFPSWELFRQQDEDYRDQVLPSGIKARLAVEAGVSQGWQEWVGDEGMVIGVNKFGASAPAERLFKEYGFTVENVIETVRELRRRLE
jgi:transketolase